MSEAYDWTRFSLHFYYHAPLTEVWRAWATPEGLCRFFVEACSARDREGRVRPADSAFEAGDGYEWVWRHGPALSGEILESQPEQRLVFTFGGMHVALDFIDTGSGVRVDLVQTRIPDTEEGREKGHLNCRSCWIFFMTNLLSVLQHGQDLRDQDPGRASSMEVGYRPAD